MVGVIKRLFVERGFGFIAGVDGVDRFFHLRDLDRTTLRFPSNTCLCGHHSFLHEQPPAGEYQVTGRCCCAMCPCVAYQRRPAPGALILGQAVSFRAGRDERGERAFEVSET